MRFFLVMAAGAFFHYFYRAGFLFGAVFHGYNHFFLHRFGFGFFGDVLTDYAGYKVRRRGVGTGCFQRFLGRAQGYFAPFAFPFAGGGYKFVTFYRAVDIAAQLRTHRAEAENAVAALNHINTFFNFGINFVFGLSPIILRIGNNGNRLVKMAA